MSKIRTSIEVIGAKQNNLKNINVEIPRDKLTVITGVSGSGKSSLAFDVIYGEAQRRFLKSVSNFAKSRIGQVKKPKVDYVRGLSPVIAIEQKKGNNNPRSTVGTVTDINDYLRLLFSTIGTGKCPKCGYVLEPVTASRIAEHIASLPQGTVVELYTAVKKVYGEDYEFLFERIRKKSYRHLLIDGAPYDLAEKPFEPEENRYYQIEVLLDKLIIKDEIYLQIVKSIETAVSVLKDEVMIRVNIPDGHHLNLGCSEHNYFLCELQPYHFSFNLPTNACNTCMGVGSSHIAEPRFLVVNPHKSIMKGALHSALFNPSAKNSYRTVVIYSLAVKYGFSLETPFDEYPNHVRDILFDGTNGESITMVHPPFMEKHNWIVSRSFPFKGFVQELESWYPRYIHNAGNADAYEPSFIKEAMIDTICPDCHGARLKASRLAITIGGMDIHALSMMQFPELIEFLNGLEMPLKYREVADSIIREITSRLQLLVDIGLHYLCLGRRSDSISGGEMQRIKMSTQISSELMGMLYVMDGPSIGLHPRDTDRVIEIMKKLRNIGNTVIVVEHDLDTMCNADYLIEIGPGAGTHGGNIIISGTPAQFMADERCLSGAYMTGKRVIPLPDSRRKPSDKCITLQGARENNLQNITLDIPLGLFVCVTGVSGSGKSTLIFETLAKNLEVIKRGARIVPGKLACISGFENIGNVIVIDQSPIGRNCKSNPATYIGIYDRIRALFAATSDAVTKGYIALDFSLTHSNGARCEHCLGDGVIVTNLQFMADIKSFCPVCKGSRFSQEGLEIKYNGKNISEVLEMTVEEALDFFHTEKLIQHKLEIMNELGSGYITLGQSATTLSGGEAQRVKLSYELGKIKHGTHNLYILDEPTTGLHCSDVEKLLISIQKLVNQGHSVIVVEHNLDVIKSADYIIDMGPEGGKGGGYIVAEGTPEEVAQVKNSFTGQCLRKVIDC
ncbi:MAG: excinuclease ABC subunit A [Clostridiales bacterium GWF2_38_85]|nr:MAG: excinuclease ABC subunit A [Clostridiales bacterium GWF2_38_85]HBL84043.1 excinuclease ABC subunit A [Clostridiales bacterium]